MHQPTFYCVWNSYFCRKINADPTMNDYHLERCLHSTICLGLILSLSVLTEREEAGRPGVGWVLSPSTFLTFCQDNKL